MFMGVIIAILPGTITIAFLGSICKGTAGKAIPPGILVIRILVLRIGDDTGGQNCHVRLALCSKGRRGRQETRLHLGVVCRGTDEV